VPIETLRKVCGHINKPFNIGTNVSFADEHEIDAVDIKGHDSGIANAVKAKVNNSHAEQKTIDWMMIPYPKLQITAKFEYI
jgi:hypothetical protein